MPSYVENNLLSDEVIIKKAKIHWFIYVPGVLIILLSLLFIGGPETVGLCTFMVIVGLLALLDAFIKYISTELAVTNKRLIAKHGFISRNTIELNLSKIESLNVDQDLFGRIFNYGLVTVNGTGGIKTPFKFIADPLSFRKSVNEEFEKTSARG
jgi:uncharacterized membrane protein YdbT with pleckstrin-like domain